MPLEHKSPTLEVGEDLEDLDDDDIMLLHTEYAIWSGLLLKIQPNIVARTRLLVMKLMTKAFDH